jgi:hypothetical protein
VLARLLSKKKKDFRDHCEKNMENYLKGFCILLSSLLSFCLIFFFALFFRHVAHWSLSNSVGIFVAFA